MKGKKYYEFSQSTSWSLCQGSKNADGGKRMRPIFPLLYGFGVGDSSGKIKP